MRDDCLIHGGELLALRVESIQLREKHWVIADLLGKAGHIRTVAFPVSGSFMLALSAAVQLARQEDVHTLRLGRDHFKAHDRVHETTLRRSRN
jgi:hypothetical protein